MELLSEKSRLKELGYHALFDWSFFLRETIKFVSRPNAKLKQLIEEYEALYFPKLPNWYQNHFPASRIAIHLENNSNITLFLPRLVKGIEIFAYTHSGTYFDQVLISSNNQKIIDKIGSELNSKKTMSQKDLLSRKKSYPKPIPIQFVPDQERRVNGVLLPLLAEAFVFSSCDAFFADFSKDFPKFVYLLMSSSRFNSLSFVKVWDVSSEGYNEQFSENDF